MPLRTARSVFIHEYILLHLYWNKGNVSKTAAALNIGRTHLIRLIAQYQLQPVIDGIRNKTFVLPREWASFVRPAQSETNM
jgi:hypothetical protein